MDKTIIIAEIGECFNGDLDAAKRLICAAKKASCDMVKFQTLDYDNISEHDPEYAWFKKIFLTKEKIGYLTKVAKQVGIQIIFTPENAKTAGWLLDFGFKNVKVASSQITDTELLTFINQNFECVFMSTGMASQKEIKNALNFLTEIHNLYLLHCISEYPTGPLLKQRGLRPLAQEDARLNMMKILMQEYPQYKVGYSDHTAGILAPIVAVGMGARVIEKHITLDRKKPIRNYLSGKEYLGTDHVLSLEPDELCQMVNQIREVEKILGPWKWERSPGEKILKKFLRERFQAK